MYHSTHAMNQLPRSRQYLGRFPRCSGRSVVCAGYIRIVTKTYHLRPQNRENTVSRPICEVKHGID